MADPRNALNDPSGPTRATWRVDVSSALDQEGKFWIEASVIAPRSLGEGASPTLLVCLPGGFLSRHYYDLEIEGSRRYSFAEAMAAAGFVVLSLDHIGTGGSTTPTPIEAGYAIGLEDIARANQRALEAALERLAIGDPTAGLQPIAVQRTIGVGHSMGSMLTVEQQALARPHAALVLFSFSTHGTPRFIDDAMRAYADDPERLRREIGDLARRTMGSPYPPRAEGSEGDRRAAFGVGTAPPDAEEALHLAATNLLAVGGLASMVPGGYAPAAEKIDVPVFMLIGDHDLHDDRHTRGELPNCPDLTTFVLEDSWHCHFVANSREILWDTVRDWVRAQAQPS